MNLFTKLLCMLTMLLSGGLAYAQLTIDLTKGIEGGGIHIAIAPFSGCLLYTSRCV